jgi:hypothetical protein
MMPLATLNQFISSVILTNEIYAPMGSFIAVADLKRNCNTMIQSANYAEDCSMDIYKSANVLSSFVSFFFDTRIFSINGDIQHPILAGRIGHFEIRHAIAAATDICNTASAADVHAEYMAGTGATKRSFSGTDIYDYTTSIGGCDTATTTKTTASTAATTTRHNHLTECKGGG